MPQVKTLYPYKGNGLDVKKDEVMFLLDKTNQDWWNVRYLEISSIVMMDFHFLLLKVGQW